MNDSTEQIPRPETSQHEKVVIEYVTPQTPPRPKDVAPSGEPGEYTATFVLGIPGKNVFREGFDFEIAPQSAESLLYVPSHEVTQIEVRELAVTGILIRFEANAAGALARAIITLQADNLADADKRTYEAVSRVLSWWSFLYDVSIDINAYYIRETRTGLILLAAGFVGQVKRLDPALAQQSHQIPHIHTCLLATYREALAATSVFYQVLCLYKVAEGIRHLHGARDRQLRAAGKSPSRPRQRIPSRSEEFGPYQGKTFNDVLDKLKVPVRNAVAHLDPTRPDVLFSDQYEDVETVQKAVPVLKYICREMLHTEIKEVLGSPP